MRVAGEWRVESKGTSKIQVAGVASLEECATPTRKNLRRKGVDCPVLCPHCEATAENVWHAFYGCPKAIECWIAGGLWDKMQELVHRAEGFKEAIFDLLVMLSYEQLLEFFMLIWCIWRRRNDKVWKEMEVEDGVAVGLARNFTTSWTKVRSKEILQTWHISSEVDLIWKKPELGKLKCNSDATLFAADGAFGVGICVRNDQGKLVVAKSMWFMGSPTPKEAEAVALLEAIKCVQAAGYTSMIFELDCKAVVDDISTLQQYNNELGTILDSCRGHLQRLQNFEVRFIRRQANSVAHSLARTYRLYASSQVFNSIPSCISRLLLNEMK